MVTIKGADQTRRDEDTSFIAVTLSRRSYHRRGTEDYAPFAPRRAHSSLNSSPFEFHWSGKYLRD